MSERTQNFESKEKTADFLIQELYKKKLKNFSKKWNTRESKVNLKKETSQNNYDFSNFGRRKTTKKINKKEIEKNKNIIKVLDDEFLHFEKMAEVIDKAKGLEALERVDIIDRMLKEVSEYLLRWFDVGAGCSGEFNAFYFFVFFLIFRVV